MTELSAWHMIRSCDVVVFAGFSESVNSATNILNKCVYDPEINTSSRLKHFPMRNYLQTSEVVKREEFRTNEV